jgi:hypothetical protein
MTNEQLSIAYEHLFLYNVCFVEEINGVVKNIETKDVRIRESDCKYILLTEL